MDSLTSDKRLRGQAALDRTISELKRFQAEHGRLPQSDEYDKYSRMGQHTRPYRFMAAQSLRKSQGVTSYYDALEKIGFHPNPGRSESDRKIKSFGLEFSREFPLEYEGRKYRVDYQIVIDGKTTLVEIDGVSHRTSDCIYHKIQPEGAEASFLKKVARDKAVNSACVSLGIPLIRIDYHHFLRLSKEEFLSLLTSTELSFALPNRDTEFCKKAQELLKSGLSLRAVASDLKCCPTTIKKRILQGTIEYSPEKTIPEAISEHKLQIDQWVLEGVAIAEIARRIMSKENLSWSEKAFMAYMNQAGYDGMSLRILRSKAKLAKAIEHRKQTNCTWVEAAKHAGITIRVLHQMKASHGIN